MPFDPRLKNMQTPPRLYALCRLVAHNPYPQKELRDLLQPPALRKEVKKYEQFNEVFSLAKAGKLIEENADGKIELNLKKHDLTSTKDFRKAIVMRIIEQAGHIFCRFTAWYLNRGKNVFKENRETLKSGFDRELNPKKELNIYNEDNIRGWRTWAAFLGYGFLHNGVLVPNVAIRLADALEDNFELERGKDLLIRDSVEWMNETCPELDYGIISQQNRGEAVWPKQHFSTGVSAGLRALHDEGKIELSYSNDATDIWYLERVDVHAINDKVSSIRIRG